LKNKNKLYIAGKTTDGKTVVKNSFKLVGTYGIGLDIVIDKLYQNDIIIDWQDFYGAAKRDGWKDGTIINLLNYAIIEVFGVEYKKRMFKILNSIRDKQ